MKLFIRTKSHGFFGGRSIRGSGNLHAISVDLETTIGQVGEKLKVLCGSNQGEPIFSLDSVDLAKEKTISGAFFLLIVFLPLGIETCEGRPNIEGSHFP